MRPYLLFLSGVAGMAGVADGITQGMVVILGTFIAFFFSYGFGQALTDCFQIDTDSISSPYRPLVKGIINKHQVLIVSLAGLFFCCLILFYLNPWTLIPGLLCVTGLATYSYFKRLWWAGPFYNAWIVALLPVMGKMAATGRGYSVIAIINDGLMVPIVISIFFSYANFVLTGYFKDISADRKSGYNTYVVAYGWTKAVKVTHMFALASIVATGWGLSGLLFSESSFSVRWFSLLFYGGAVTVLTLAQYGIQRINNEKQAHGPITHVVRGFILLHLAEICALQPGWIWKILIFYLLFEITLKARPEESQV